MSGDPAVHVRLPHPQLHLLVEQLQHRHRVGHPPVHAAERDRAAAADDVDRRVEGVELVEPAVCMSFLASASGSSPTNLCAAAPTGEPCASMPTASITASGPRPPVSPRTTSPRSLPCWRRSIVWTSFLRARSSRSGTRSTPITVSTPRCVAIRVAMSPIGPRPEHGQGAAGADARVLHRLPGGGQHVGQVDEPVVRRPVRHLDSRGRPGRAPARRHRQPGRRPRRRKAALARTPWRSLSARESRAPRLGREERRAGASCRCPAPRRL